MDRCDKDELDTALIGAGYRLARMGELPTHAQCVHGMILPVGEDNHSCTWRLLVRNTTQGVNHEESA